MKFIVGLLFLLAISIVMGVIRKLRGGTFLPPPAPDEEYVVHDRTVGLGASIPKAVLGKNYSPSAQRKNHVFA
jgi:hypothetical protein